MTPALSLELFGTDAFSFAVIKRLVVVERDGRINTEPWWAVVPRAYCLDVLAALAYVEVRHKGMKCTADNLDALFEDMSRSIGKSVRPRTSLLC